MPYADPDIARAAGRERFRQRIAGRIARGECTGCGQRPPESGRRLCAGCGAKRRNAERARSEKRRAAGIRRERDPKARHAEYRRARIRAGERLAHGICSRCGEHPHEPDRRLCARCGERRRRRERERYAQARDKGMRYGGRDPRSRRRLARRRSRAIQSERREAGFCIRCGKLPPVEAGSSCEPCLENRRVADRRIFASRRASGRCTRCGTPAFKGAPVCGPCTVLEARYLEKKYDANRRRYFERRARWICTSCGKNPSFGASRCEPCAKRAYERSEHVRGVAVYPPSFTVIERATEINHGEFDTWEEVAIALAFARLSLDDVDVIVDHPPMYTSFID